MKKRIAGGLAVVATVAGITAVANGAVSGETDPTPDPAAVARVTAKITKPDTGDATLSRAFGVDPDTAKPVGKLSDGTVVSVGVGSDGNCVLFSRDGQPTDETCGYKATIAAGKAAGALNDCSKIHGKMRISALLPSGATSGALVLNDRSVGAKIEAPGSAVWFEGVTPAEGEAYPTQIAAYDGAGKQIATVDIPVRNGSFCPTTK